jgi:ribonuclease-3
VVWDYKSRLQEYCQAQKNEIRYSIKGIEKRKRRQIFVIELNDEMNTFREIGKGSSKKEAEQEAAAKVVKKLGIEMISGSEDNPIKCSNLRKKKAAR